MMTIGREPTLGEVLDYYTREDFLGFLLDMIARYRVVAVIPTKLHWEPNWEHNEIQADSVDELREVVLQKITAAFPGVSRAMRPAYYPSFHQSVTHRTVGLHEGGRMDCIFEADLPTWRDSFRDVGAAVTLMEQYGVRYRLKFSGHRSLHLVIPADLIPQGYRGKAAGKLARHITQWSSSQAHHLPQLTRMPYSLNEDTGLVCLPIARGALAAFRPWMANPHLVDVRVEAWHEELTDSDADRFVAFLEAVDQHEPAINARYFVADRTAIVRTVRRQAPGDGWGQLTADLALPEERLLSALEIDDADARWLALEAYLLRGAGLSQAGIQRLLAEDEEYARVTAVDTLLRFEDAVVPTLVTMMDNLNTYSVAGAQAAYVLTQSESLRHKVLDALVARTGQSTDALLVSACLAGAMAGDWDGAMHVLAPLDEDATLTGAQRLKVQALHLIRKMGTNVPFGTWSRRDGAIQAQQLAEMGPEVIDLLLLAAGSPNRRLRRDLVTALAELADPRSVDLLVAALADDYSQVRRKAIAALTRIGEPAVDTLIEALGSDQAQVRRNAVLCLGYIGKQEIQPARIKSAVAQLLDDSDEDVRRQVARVMKTLATEDDLERLLQFLRDATTGENAQHATEALAALGDTGRLALEKLALEEYVFGAAYYLATQGDARGGDILADLLDSEYEIERQAAMELLAKLHDPRCVPLLAAQLQTLTDWKTLWYAHQLGEIGTPDAVDALIAALERDHRFTRRGAVRGLGLAKDPRAVPHLIGCLGDGDGKTRSEAAEALIAIGEATVAPLQAVWAEDAPEARKIHNRVKHILAQLGIEAGSRQD